MVAVRAIPIGLNARVNKDSPLNTGPNAFESPVRLFALPRNPAFNLFNGPIGSINFFCIVLN